MHLKKIRFWGVWPLKKMSFLIQNHNCGLPRQIVLHPERIEFFQSPPSVAVTLCSFLMSCTCCGSHSWAFDTSSLSRHCQCPNKGMNKLPWVRSEESSGGRYFCWLRRIRCGLAGTLLVWLAPALLFFSLSLSPLQIPWNRLWEWFSHGSTAELWE